MVQFDLDVLDVAGQLALEDPDDSLSPSNEASSEEETEINSRTSDEKAQLLKELNFDTLRINGVEKVADKKPAPKIVELN